MKAVEDSKRLAYIESEIIEETQGMKEISKALREDDKAIQVSPHEGAIISGLLRIKQAKNIVEVGTLYGYSTSWFLEALAPEAKVWTVEKSVENTNKAKQYLFKNKRANQVEVVHSSGKEFFNNWSGEDIDFLFIDADKGGYLDYLELALPFLKPGAVVVGDNTFLFGMALEKEPPKDYSQNTWRKMREFNKRLGLSDQFKGFMIPTLQGMTVGVKL